jgi:DNA-binding phage protein
MTGATIPPSRPYADGLRNLYADDAEAIGMFAYALENIAAGEADEGKHALRSLIKGRIGFEELSRRIEIPARSLNRMLSSEGNPSLSNLAAIIRALHQELGIEPKWILTAPEAA